MSCTICAGTAAIMAEENKPLPHAFLEGFVLGIVVERACGVKGQNVIEYLCPEHLAEVRRLCNLIPDTVIAPAYRGAILNFGLSVVRP